MHHQYRDIINKKKFDIRSRNINRFYKNTITFEYSVFLKKLESLDFIINTIENISNGTIYVLKNSIERETLLTFEKILDEICKTDQPINPKILSGAKNGFYISANIDGAGYKAIDRSFYFFSWNKDKTGIYKKIIELYKPLKILNGLGKEAITKNIPLDGIIERLHVIHYPLGSGQISKHYDPINTSIFNFGLYGTEYGNHYDEGGFFVEDKNQKKIMIDKDIKMTDIVIFFPGIIHGVDQIQNKKKKNFKSIDGRWFFNVNLVQSHEEKKREYTQSVD
jgi:hypothetical protein